MTDQITLPRAVVEQALEALQHLAGVNCDHSRGICVCEYRDAANNLSAALAQAKPVQVTGFRDVRDYISEQESDPQRAARLETARERVKARQPEPVQPDEPLSMSMFASKADYERAQQQAEPVGTRALIEECLAAFAEELAAYDIDPPLHHVKQAHDKCMAWLNAPQQAEPVQRKPLTEDEIDKLMQRIGLRCADEGNPLMTNHAEWQRRTIARAIDAAKGGGNG